MNLGSKVVIGLLFVLALLQLAHALNAYTLYGSIHWFKLLAGLLGLFLSASGFYWVKRNPHRS